MLLQRTVVVGSAAVGRRSVRACCCHAVALRSNSSLRAPAPAAAAAAAAASAALQQHPGAGSRQRAAFAPQQQLRAHSRLVVASAADAATVELEVKVEGMKCGGCSSRVENVLKGMDHVKAAKVDLESKLATVEVEAPSLLDAMNMLPTFVTAIKELGFEAEPFIEYEVQQ